MYEAFCVSLHLHVLVLWFRHWITLLS